MPVWLLSIATSKAGRYALAIGAALVALAVAVARIFSMGRKAERADNQIKAGENEHARTQIDVDVAGASDVERERLRKRWTRP